MESRRILFVCDGFRKTYVCIDLIANAFRGWIQNTKLFSIFSSFIFCFIIYLFEKRTGAYSCLPSKDSLNYSLSLFKGWFLFSTKYFLFVYMNIDLLKLKAYKEANLCFVHFAKFPESSIYNSLHAEKLARPFITAYVHKWCFRK